MRTAAKVALVLVTWPFVYLADKARRVDPSARLRTGMDWARRPR